MANNAKAIGENGKFISIIEMSVDVLLLGIRAMDMNIAMRLVLMH